MNVRTPRDEAVCKPSVFSVISTGHFVETVHTILCHVQHFYFIDHECYITDLFFFSKILKSLLCCQGKSIQTVRFELVIVPLFLCVKGFEIQSFTVYRVCITEV